VGDDLLEGTNLVIAAEARPVDLKIPGAEHPITSEQFLELDELPARIVFIGGGYISFEFAHLAARAGAHATIFHRGPRPLERFDPNLADQLVRRTRGIGIDVQLKVDVRSIARAAVGFRVQVSGEQGVGSSKRTWWYMVPGAYRRPMIWTSTRRALNGTCDAV
jgi:glutathione reductase (NADPH)